MKSLKARVQRLEVDSGLFGDLLTRLSDAELDEEIVRSYADCEAAGLDPLESSFYSDVGTEPVLFWRESMPMATDIKALALKRAGRVFYDECADMSVEQIHSRVKAHIARLATEDRKRSGGKKHVAA